jgi:hypothetical protein
MAKGDRLLASLRSVEHKGFKEIILPMLFEAKTAVIFPPKVQVSAPKRASESTKSVLSECIQLPRCHSKILPKTAKLS